VRLYLGKPFTKIGVVEWLKVKALSSSPSTTKKKKKKDWGGLDQLFSFPGPKFWDIHGSFRIDPSSQ
jgi:hypothetical protein